MASSTLNKFIIHQLVKGEDDPRLADELLDLTDDVISSLAEKILELFEKKTSVIYGVFRSLSQTFPSEFKVCYQSSISDEQFKQLTRSTMNSMQLAMKNTAGTGGYITFIDYSKGVNNYLLAVMIKDTKAFQLKGLKPKEASRVDTSKLYQAINISVKGFINALKSESTDEVRSYVSFITKANEPSGYFLDAFSCRTNVTPSKATTAAPKAARQFILDCGADKKTAKKAYYAIVDLLIEHAEKPISFNKIHRKVNEFIPEDNYETKKEDFIAFAKGEEFQIPEEFQSKGNTAKGLRQIKGKGEGWELQFDKEMIGLKDKDVNKTFMYDKENDYLYMPTLPDELKSRIHAELNIIENNGS